MLLNNLFPQRTEPPSLRIPELPRGRTLRVKLLRSWGDKDYVGLSAIEVFDGRGEKVRMRASAEFSRLIDENFLTCDGNFMWAVKAQSAEIVLDLGARVEIAMIRIWNYNKSRTYASRGCKDISICLDENNEVIVCDHIKIFRGEIKKAMGTLSIENCEYLMFTTREATIASIVANDWINESPVTPSYLNNTVKINRPDTATLRHMASTKQAP